MSQIRLINPKAVALVSWLHARSYASRSVTEEQYRCSTCQPFTPLTAVPLLHSAGSAMVVRLRAPEILWELFSQSDAPVLGGQEVNEVKEFSLPLTLPGLTVNMARMIYTSQSLAKNSA